MILLIPSLAHAQTTDTLKEAQVKAKTNPTNDPKVNAFAPGQQLVTMDSLTMQQYRMQTVSNLLAQQLPVFIKSYTFSGLSTLSFRGSSAAQSQVLWNGVPIQNSALGIADVSTLPVLLLNRVSVLYGGSSALYGSGNVGGALLLESEVPVFDSGKRTLAVSGGAGSFGQYSGAIDGSVAGKRWYLSLKGLLQTATNDFTYTNDTGRHLKLANGIASSKALMLNSAVKTGRHSVLSLSVWGQQYNREIPLALFETASQKKQTDGSLRLLADWTKHTENNTWYAKTSFIHDNIQYDDAAIGLHSNSRSSQYYQEVGLRRQGRKKGQWLVFIPVQFTWMREPVTNAHKQQLKAAVAAAYSIKFFRDKLAIAANARGEMVAEHKYLLPGADASLLITKWLTLRANVQRTYRVPTLNELYYNPGGNPYLKPEQGWNEDAGYTAKFKLHNLTITHDLSAFNRNIEDWIIWIGGAIFTPHNIAKVHSRGIETDNKLECTIGKWKLHLGLSTAYVLATTESSYIPNDGSIGKQIPYTPRYNGRLNIGAAYKRLYFNYNHSYTGYRFKNYDESDYFEPYQTGNMQAMYTTTLKKHTLQLTAQCNNIWNQYYEIIAYRPMPGINWLAGFRLGI